MPRRVFAAIAIAAVVAGIAAIALRPERGVPDDAPNLDAMAKAVGSEVMLHVQRGHVPGRSGDIMLVPRPHRYIIGDWDLRTLGSDRPTTATSHPNPWAYLSRVPIIVYGEKWVPRDATSTDEVDIADLAPTYSKLLGVSDFTAEGDPLEGVDLRPTRLPRAIVTVVIDGGGWNVLQRHPDAWPSIRRIQAGGTTYQNATIGSAPSITGALHATFGTGSYPIHHGINGNQLRDDDGKNVDSYLDNADPRFLQLPTVSELWDEQNGNEPVVATVSYEGWHLGMIGHGAQRDGGDRDVAALWDVEADRWWINEDYYTLPEYLDPTNITRLEGYEQDLDERDGVIDDSWFGHTLEQVQEEDARGIKRMRPGTPALARFTGDAVIDVLRNERIGRDETTDLYWIEMKMPDYAGHIFTIGSGEEEDVLAETDRQIGRLKRALDRFVGRDRYLLAISADHGQQPLADEGGGWRIDSTELERDIESRFGPVVEKVTPVDIYLDRAAIDREKVDPVDIARYIGTYTIRDNIREGKPGLDRVPVYRMSERLFAGAFPSAYLQELTEPAIAALGRGDYPEGDLYRAGSDEDRPVTS